MLAQLIRLAHRVMAQRVIAQRVILHVGLAVLLVGGLAGCGDDDETGSLRVHLTVEPEREVYLATQRVSLRAEVTDLDGRAVPSAEVAFTISPEGAASIESPGVFVLHADGVVTFEACATQGARRGCTERALIVDGAPPSITITSPSPGEELLASEHPTIVVTGSVHDENPLASLGVFVNGSAATVDEAGNFSAEIEAGFGVHHIEVEARDGYHPPSALHLDVLWAENYLEPRAGTTTFDLGRGMSLRLGQRLFDLALQGSALDRSTDPIVARDLASIAELLLWHADLPALLGDGPVIEDDNVTLSVVGVELGSVVVDIVLVNGVGFDLYLDLGAVDLLTDGAITLPLGDPPRTLSLEGGVRADLHAIARIEVGLDDQGELSIEVGEVDAFISSLQGRFTGDDGEPPDGEVLNAFLVLADHSFTNLITGMVNEELMPAFTGLIPSLLGDLLLAVENVFSDVAIELDPGLGEPVTLQIDAHIESVERVAGPTAGHLTSNLDLRVGTAEAPIQSTRGAAQAAVAPNPPFSAFGPVQLGIRQDFINALLHALWNGGLLEGAVAFGDNQVDVSAKLPPVVRAAPLDKPCTIGLRRCDAVIEVGQLEVGAFGQRFGIYARAGVVVDIEGGNVALLLEEVPELIVWELSEEGGLFGADTVRDLVTTQLWVDLRSSLESSLQFALPIPEADELGLATIAPALEGATLSLMTLDRIDLSSGYLGLSADLELSVSPQ